MTTMTRKMTITTEMTITTFPRRFLPAVFLPDHLLPLPGRTNVRGVDRSLQGTHLLEPPKRS